MSRNALWRVSVLTCPEAEDAVSELLASATGGTPSSYTDFETQVTEVSVYLRNRRQVTRAKLAGISQALEALQGFGLRVAPGRMRVRRLTAASWKNSWRRHFKVLEIGARLIVKPSWSRRRPRTGQAVVVLDPGLSFGTGQHPTTAFCLRHLVRFRRFGRPQSCLDIGTGSGILAISAAKLGYAPVDAFDVDPESLRVARANARRNGIEKRIHLFRGDVASLPRHANRRYSVVCANLVSKLLIDYRVHIVNCLAEEGILLLAGILATEFEAVQHAYKRAGLCLARSRLQREWRSGAFCWSLAR